MRVPLIRERSGGIASPRDSARCRGERIGVLLGISLVLAGCGAGTTATATASPGTGALRVAPQNGTLLVGVDRVGVALFTGTGDTPVQNAVATLAITRAGGGRPEIRPLQFIGPRYGNIPIYVGAARFDSAGAYTYSVHATLTGGRTVTGAASVSVTTKSPELPVGFPVPADASQRVLADAGGDVSRIDSGVPPDNFHDHTVADGLATHHPMVLYFGQPGHCVSETCGPTVAVLQDFAKTFGDRFWTEHIEIHDPADSQALNPVYLRFALSSEPWVYFVNAHGVVSDRFEGPITVDELAEAARGTLAGRVPAVDVEAS